MPRVQFEDLVSAADIARRLGMSRQAVQQALKRGSMDVKPIGQIGRSVIYRWRDVEKWAAKTTPKKRRGSAPAAQEPQ